VLLVSHDRALLDAVPDRIVAIEDRVLRSYDGGWADLERERTEKTAAVQEPPAIVPEKPTPTPAPRPRPVKKRPSELERLEAQIAATEARIADLERKLADDWTNMDVLGAHRAARDELTALLARWEVLFEEAPAS
jgi:ATP-binding cassette subfamily F protein 3